jgi:hypothetical protein
MFLQKIAYCRSSKFVPFTNYYQGCEIKVNEMEDEACEGEMINA